MYIHLYIYIHMYIYLSVYLSISIYLALVRVTPASRNAVMASTTSFA